MAEMGFHTVIEGNAFYEIDEDCLRKRSTQQDAAGKEGMKGKAEQRTNQGMNQKTGGNSGNKRFF